MGLLLAQYRAFAAAILALFNHHGVMLERELRRELGIHQLLLRKSMHGGEHALGACRAIDHQHANAFL